MRYVPSKVTYLEMRSPPAEEILAPVADVKIRMLAPLTVENYRRLYTGVGQEYQWVDRIMMADESLREIIHHDRVEVYELLVADETAGYSELDRRQHGEIEIAYFGLFPHAVGKGLGKFFLNWTLHKAWTYQPKRVWLHTCDLDHPAALPNYLRAGLTIYDEQTEQQAIPDDG